MTDYIEKHGVDTLTVDDSQVMIALKHVPLGALIMSRFMEALAAAKINVDIISRTSPINDCFDVSFMVDANLPAIEKIIAELSGDFPAVQISLLDDVTRLSIHGIGMRTQSGVAAKYFKVFADNNIRIMMITTSEICISCMVHRDDAERGIAAICDAFDLEM